MSNVYQKLQECRVKLQAVKLKKSGKNKYSGYDYFELEDFLPKVNELFQEHKLTSLISFTPETATLTIVNTEQPEETIVFTSPMAEASLKGCHPIQNLGAVQSYQRRYLYIAALEIAEHDALDSTIGNGSGEKPTTKTTKAEEKARKTLEGNGQSVQHAEQQIQEEQPAQNSNVIEANTIDEINGLAAKAGNMGKLLMIARQNVGTHIRGKDDLLTINDEELALLKGVVESA